METNERIKKLCKERGVTIQRLEIELGEKPTSIAKVSSNSKAEKLYKIARYFGVTVDYLITGDSPAAFILRDDEADILKVYNSLNAAGKKELLKLAKMVSSQSEYMLKGEDSQSSNAV